MIAKGSFSRVLRDLAMEFTRNGLNEITIAIMHILWCARGETVRGTVTDAPNLNCAEETAKFSRANEIFRNVSRARERKREGEQSR